MKVEVTGKGLADVTADALVVGVYAGERPPGRAAQAIDTALGGQLRAVLEAEKFQGKPGHVTHVHTAPKSRAARVVVVGLGAREDVTLENVRRAASAGLRRARDLGARHVAIDLLADKLDARQRAHATVEGAVLGTYTFERYKREKSDKAVERLTLVAPDAGDRRAATGGARTGELFAEATWFARDLVNGPANEITPTHLAAVASEVAREAKLGVKIYDRAECDAMGMGAFLAVAAGSQQPPKFIHLTYKPGGRTRRRIAIIGKGITFDAGGLDLKTAEGMLRMKDDMSGAAAVLGVMRALPELAPPVEVHGLIAAPENMPSGSAFRPGDVLRAMNGTTIEIGNTDAEGRLTLADALAYAAKHVKPDEAIDLATLTGACVVALGRTTCGLFGTPEPWVQLVQAIADRAGDRCWPMPLFEDYREQLRSEIADMMNTGGRPAGSITAAIFLKEFTGGLPWAHLDIAGTSWSDESRPFQPKGPIAAGIRTIAELAFTVGQEGW